MEAKITHEVLESYTFCKYKSYLKLLGQQGDKSEYESFLIDSKREVRLKATEKIRVQNEENQIVSNIVLTLSALAQGPLFVLDATLEGDFISLSLDGLKKVSGVSNLGQFSYIPMLFHAGSQVRKEQRLLLELHAFFLSRYQAIAPSLGIIWHGKACKAITVRLNPDPRKAKQILAELKKMRDAEAPPKLILNDHCQICEFRQRCRNQALQEDSLSLLRGISEKKIKGYNRAGILTITQLAHTFRPRRKGKRAKQETTLRYHALQALALRDKRIYVFGTPKLPTSPVRIFLDVESDPDAGFVYLIGLIIVENGSETHYSFWADNKDQESDIFEQFVTLVIRYEPFIVFCYGNYERTFIARMRKMAKSLLSVDKILNALVNILSCIYAHIYFPTYSNSLKEIGRYVGCTWTESNASGIQSIIWRAQWETQHNEAWKLKLVTYNFEDCAALKRVTEILQTIIIKTDPQGVSLQEDIGDLPIALVQDIEKLSNFHTWGKVKYVHPDYEFVNNHAYFDYQRERVYVRTNKVLRKIRANQAPSPNRKLRASKQVAIRASECPVCNSADIISGIKKQVRTQEPRVKRAFDISLTSTGMRRRVIEYRTSLHQCLTCGEEFIPEQYQRLDKHFHGLKSWAMFHHVEYRISLLTITKMLEDFFGIRVFEPEIYMFKSLMASYYKATYQKLLEKILSGTLLHVDETEVRLQNTKGYVWVFTNLEEVVYMYRPTREGEFLYELLRDFHGVLVSDFYATYDGLGCPQQKCLIHLMRDINQELLNNPFDDELKSITQPFGTLLRRIITTVDEYGLVRKYLKQHKTDAEQFFRTLTEQSIFSDTAEMLRTRLIKYRHKLFTFIDYNGVPWNNNNAEHAIKQFAYYREDTSGMMEEPGLSDYLILLSICQTCKYKGVSFLKFLLSQEQDVDVFCQKKKRRRRLSSVELYPEGFIPPILATKHKKRSQQKSENTESLDQDETDTTSRKPS